MLPDALVVHAELPAPEAPVSIRLDAGVSAVAHYAAFHLREHEREAEPAVLEAFEALHAEASEDT